MPSDLDYEIGMLYLSPNNRFVILNPLQDSIQRRIGQCTTFSRVHCNMTLRPLLLSPMALFNTDYTITTSKRVEFNHMDLHLVDKSIKHASRLIPKK